MTIIHIELQQRPGDSPSTWDFQDETISVGRGPDCDLALGESVAVASSCHLSLTREGSRLVLRDLESTNGTYCNGRRVERPVTLRPGDRIRMGSEGPELMATLRESISDAPVAGTANNQDAWLRTLDPSAPSPSFDDAAVVRMFPGQESAAPVRLRQEPAHSEPVRLATKKRAARSMPRTDVDPPNEPKRPIGLQTMTRMLNHATQKERRRTAALLGAVTLVGASALIWRSGGVQADEGMSTVLAQTRDSVYVVLTRRAIVDPASGEKTYLESAQGTAWSAAPGMLATNAHVAELFDAVEDGLQLIARSSADPPIDLLVTGAQLHPGYSGFSERSERISPFDSASTQIFQVPPAYDVALLQIEALDTSDGAPSLSEIQAPALPRLSSNDFATIQQGQAVAYVGFPGEGLSRSGTDLGRPSPKSATGTMSRLMDPFIGRPESSDTADCLEYNIEVTGGASGSPVVDAQGRVIGLINAGDVLDVTARGRIGTGGTSYGPRVDLVDELLDGTAEAKWNERSEWVEGRLLTLFHEGTQVPEIQARAIAMPVLQKTAEILGMATSGDLVSKASGVVRIESAGDGGAVRFNVNAGTQGLRAVVAISTTHPLGLRLTPAAGNTAVGFSRTDSGDPPRSYDFCLLEPASRSTRLSFQLTATDDRFFAPGDVRIYVVRLD